MEGKRRKKWVSLVDLDNDILVLIFTRLPIAAILGCKRVCKSWYLFISSSYFANSYRANPPFTSIIISNSKQFSLLELNGDCNYSVKHITPKFVPNPFGSNDHHTKLVGSCNGYLCFTKNLNGYIYYADNELVSVTNPLSGINFMLPNQRPECNGAPRTSSDGLLKRKTSCYGFGFCPKTQQYKVVEIAKYGRSSRTELNVFTLGIDKSWRRLVHEHPPFPQAAEGCTWYIDFSMQFCVVNGNGALHWIVKSKGRVDYLYSFDITEEKVRPVPPPVGLKKRRDFTRPVFLQGCLCLLHRNEENTIEFWCMKDYMVSDSWTLSIIPQTRFPGFMRHKWFHTLAVWENEEVFIALKLNSLYYYNHEQENFARIKLVLGNTSPTYHAAACFVPNFLPFLEAGTAVGQTK